MKHGLKTPEEVELKLAEKMMLRYYFIFLMGVTRMDRIRNKIDKAREAKLR